MSESVKRQIAITLAGEAIQDGRVSVLLFTKTLQAIQDVIYQIADSRIRKDLKTEIIKSSKIKKECELFLVETLPGSLRAVMELPPKPPSLFPEMLDFSDYVVAETHEALDAIKEGDEKKLKHILPDLNLRQRLIRKIENIAPAEGADYSLSFSFSGRPQIQLLRPSKDVIERLIAMPSLKEEKEKDIRFIEAKGLAQMEHGNIKRWIETYSIREVSELPLDLERVWRTHEIKAKGKVFHLIQDIACVIEKQDDQLFSEDEGLGIFAYGESREDVIREFSDEFATLWESIAQEEDDKLTQDAILLKKKLLESVRKVESHGDAENAGDQKGLN